MGEYCRILIADDERMIRQGIRHMADWEKEGFLIVGEAGDGQEALRLVREQRPHIVLADIVMPVMDGLEFSARLSEEFPQIQLIMLSSYDKFEYVKTALLNGASDYILKPMLSVEGLLQTLRKAAAKILDVQFCSGGKTSCEMLLARYLGGYEKQLYERDFLKRPPYARYRLLGIHIKGQSRDKIESICQKARDFFKEYKKIASVITPLDESVLCAALNYGEDSEAQCQTSVSELADKMAHYDARPFLALSWDYTDVLETRRVFEEGVKKLLSMKFYFPGKNLVVLEEKPAQQKRVRFEYDVYAKNLDSLELDEAVSMFYTYMECLASAYEDEYKIKNLAKNLLFNYFVALERMGESREDIRDACFLEIDQTEDVESFFSVIRKYIPDPDACGQKKYDLTYDCIVKMKEYIGIHYQEDLKLMDLAKQFGFSYCYISTYFKENMAEGFSGYLNKIRIGKAKDMLLNTGMTITEVGSEAGYTDQSYFCRVFKKMVGVTPGRYRKNKGGKGREMEENYKHIDV